MCLFGNFSSIHSSWMSISLSICDNSRPCDWFNLWKHPYYANMSTSHCTCPKLTTLLTDNVNTETFGSYCFLSRPTQTSYGSFWNVIITWSVSFDTKFWRTKSKQNYGNYGVGNIYFFMFLREISYYGFVYSIKNTVKTIILWNCIIFFLF